MKKYVSLEGNKAIEMVLGDSRAIEITIDNQDVIEFIDSLIFTCKKYNIQGRFVKRDDGVWEYDIPTDKITFPSVTTYDITLILTNSDGSVDRLTQTGIEFRVIDKCNPIEVDDGM